MRTSPISLKSVLNELSYKGWKFYIGSYSEPDGLFDGHPALVIEALVLNSGGRFNRPAGSLLVEHTFPITLPADADTAEAMRFVLDCVIKVETHEAMEFFTIGDPEYGGGKPFFPQHGPLSKFDAYEIPEPWSTT